MAPVQPSVIAVGGVVATLPAIGGRAFRIRLDPLERGSVDLMSFLSSPPMPLGSESCCNWHCAGEIAQNVTEKHSSASALPTHPPISSSCAGGVACLVTDIPGQKIQVPSTNIKNGRFLLATFAQCGYLKGACFMRFTGSVRSRTTPQGTSKPFLVAMAWATARCLSAISSRKARFGSL